MSSLVSSLNWLIWVPDSVARCLYGHHLHDGLPLARCVLRCGPSRVAAGPFVWPDCRHRERLCSPRRVAEPRVWCRAVRGVVRDLVRCAVPDCRCVRVRSAGQCLRFARGLSRVGRVVVLSPRLSVRLVDNHESLLPVAFWAVVSPCGCGFAMSERVAMTGASFHAFWTRFSPGVRGGLSFLSSATPTRFVSSRF